MSDVTLARVLYDSVNSRVAKFIDDSGDSLLAVVGKLRNVAGTIINPATEGKQDDAITKLTSLDGKDFATQTTLATLATETKLEAVRVLLASLDGKDYATQTTLAAILADTAGIEVILTAIRDTAGIKKITDELPAGTQEVGAVKQGTKAALADAWPAVLTDADGNAFDSQLDVGVRRLEVAGIVAVVGASAPPNTTGFSIFADTPLAVGSHDTIFVIPDGTTAHLQQLTCGNEDPTKGASVEVIYDDVGTERLIARIYTSGQSEFYGFADIWKSRDETELTGNAAGTKTIILRRAKYSGTNIAIDAVIRGYTV